MDVELVVRAQSGDQAAFAEIAASLYSRLHRVARRGEHEPHAPGQDVQALVHPQAIPTLGGAVPVDLGAGRSHAGGDRVLRDRGRDPSIRDAMPLLLGADRGSRLLLLEDLGEAQDLTPLYRGGRLSREQLGGLVDYLVALHAPVNTGADGQLSVSANREMRALNHDHVFRIPLARDNGLDLDGITPGLAAAAERLKVDGRYVKQVTELGRIYLADGDHLVHGDYFPGCWLSTGSGVRIIDPEFCFMGPRAFDLGIMLGHLHLARQPQEVGVTLLSLYRERTDTAEEVSRMARGFAGVEIMRRLIGVARLPLGLGIEEKERLLDLSRELVVTP